MTEREMTEREQKELISELYGMRFDDVYNLFLEAALRSGRFCCVKPEERENWREELRFAVHILMKYIKIRDIQVMTYPEILMAIRRRLAKGESRNDAKTDTSNGA